MGLKQDAPVPAANDISEQLPMFAENAEALGDAVFAAAHDIDDRKRQQALRGFLECGVEHLVELLPQDDGGRVGSAEPQERQQYAEPQAEPRLKAQGAHGVPSL